MKIRFRPHRRSDVPHRVKWLHDPETVRWLGTPADQKLTLEAQAQWFEKYIKDCSRKFFTICDGRLPIGVVGLTRIATDNKNAEVFIMIGENEYRGKGIGTHAMKFIVDHGFKKLKLQKIKLGVVTANKAAMKCYTKVGFIKEGILRKEECIGGKYYDLQMMAIFKK